MQLLLSFVVSTEQSVNMMRSQCKPSDGRVIFTECSKVNIVFSIYRVTLYLSSLQWPPSLKLHCVISMDQASTSTECIMMLSNVVDIEYQKFTNSSYKT